MHSDSKKLRSFLALLFVAGDVKRWEPPRSRLRHEYSATVEPRVPYRLCCLLLDSARIHSANQVCEEDGQSYGPIGKALVSPNGSTNSSFAMPLLVHTFARDCGLFPTAAIIAAWHSDDGGFALALLALARGSRPELVG